MRQIFVTEPEEISSSTISYATVGTGWITEAFIRGAMQVEGLELRAVYSRSMDKAEAFAKQYEGVDAYDNLADLAASDVEAVYIASPNSLHYEQSRLFLENGKHVICEKPITVTPEQLFELQKLAEANDVVYMEAIMMLHQPQRKLLRDAMQRIGNISAARFDYSQLSSKYESFRNGENPNIFNPDFAAGCLMDMGIYCVYPAIDLFGTPQKIHAVAGILENGIDGFINAIYQYEDISVGISSSKIGQGRIGSEILGDLGTIVIDEIWHLAKMRIHWKDGTIEEIFGSVAKDDLMAAEAQSFWRYITEREESAAEYAYAKKLSLAVSHTMSQMRHMTGATFAEDEAEI